MKEVVYQEKDHWWLPIQIKYVSLKWLGEEYRKECAKKGRAIAETIFSVLLWNCIDKCFWFLGGLAPHLPWLQYGTNHRGSSGYQDIFVPNSKSIPWLLSEGCFSSPVLPRWAHTLLFYYMRIARKPTYTELVGGFPHPPPEGAVKGGFNWGDDLKIARYMPNFNSSKLQRLLFSIEAA